ncbi:MAG: hypothetical protein FJ096_17520, partial [Deltaproteobacteria bacterium]|nr:hypothetical protein [Deltaproteobacteria bacterium]
MFRRSILTGVLLVGCASTEARTAKAPESSTLGGTEVERRDVEFKHEPCDLTSSQVQGLDADLNGRPEILTVFDGGKALCRAVDLNLDGVIDVFVYFDAAGQPRRRESGFDRDATPDEIATFEGGKLVRKERETNNDGKLDTWDYYENGRLVREERDSSGNGFITQWWTFSDPARPDCAQVLTDLN